MNDLSLYIHIPFCKRFCTYCNFVKYHKNEDLEEKYLVKLFEEIDSYKELLNKRNIKTIYIGGGSPSVLSYKNLESLLKVLDKYKAEVEEYTIELMPSDVNEDLLKLLKEHNINRISLGVESINPNIMKDMGRVLDTNFLSSKINLVKKYFPNFNLDLIYGFKGETIEDLKKDLDFILSFEPKHISTYLLEISTDTYLGKTGYQGLNDEEASKEYYFIKTYLEKAGYNQYEISNYSRKGYESKHNLVYWHNKHYLGLGVSASSYTNNIRFTNTSDLNKYPSIEYTEELNMLDTIKYEMILNLRLTKGINKKNFYKKYNKEIKDIYDIDSLIKKGFIIEEDDFFKINPKYLFVSNYIYTYFI